MFLQYKVFRIVSTQWSFSQTNYEFVYKIAAHGPLKVHFPSIKAINLFDYFHQVVQTVPVTKQINEFKILFRVKGQSEA